MIKALKTGDLENIPTFIKRPEAKNFAKIGEMITFEAVTSGAKPIGTYDLLL